MKIKNLAVKGEKQTTPVASISSHLQPIESYKISGANRDIQKTHIIDIQDNDKLLEFVFDDEQFYGLRIHDTQFVDSERCFCSKQQCGLCKNGRSVLSYSTF